MTTPVVPSLVDEQIADIERSLAIINAGLPRELPVAHLPPKLVAAIKAGRISVRPRQ
ncbi:hypothetical protein NPS29_12540 [Pseudomonas putida]|uniref:hypothetical protein n=1 Tax=Pseudomonas putida TaxID=303 RepID=UPI002363B78F|nr:hypothetical protein [Pseudomonas putida]MDD1966149.1 hypothetical protein [Pseudomonas putida]